MSGQLREWLMAWRAFAGNLGLLIQHRAVPAPAGLSAPVLSLQKPCAGGCPADVLVLSPQLVLAGKCPKALGQVSPGPGEEVALALRTVHGAAQAGSQPQAVLLSPGASCMA